MFLRILQSSVYNLPAYVIALARYLEIKFI